MNPVLITCHIHFMYLTYHTYNHLLYLQILDHLCVHYDGQSQFNPRDVPFRTMRTMSNSIMNEMFPGEKIHKVEVVL